MEMVSGKCYSIYYQSEHKENLEQTARALSRLYPRDGAQRSIECTKSGINNSLYHFIGNGLSPKDGLSLSNGFTQVAHCKATVCGKRAQVVPRSPYFEAYKSHTMRHTHTRYDPSERVISSSQRPLPAQLIPNTRDEHPCPQGDSNPRTQDSRSRRHTPLFARPSGSAFQGHFHHNFSCVNCFIIIIIIIIIMLRILQITTFWCALMAQRSH
jgi:hypothetical protein